MGSVTICPFVYNPTNSSSNSSFSKVHLNLNVRVYGSFGHPCLLMKSISSSQFLTSVYAAWSWFGDSVSNGSNPLEWFQVRVRTRTEPLHWVLPHENPDRCNWAGFTNVSNGLGEPASSLGFDRQFCSVLFQTQTTT
jgi:hypothetical protein